MTIQEQIRHLRTELIERMKQGNLGLFGWTLTSKSSSMGDQDQVQTADQSDNSVGDGRQRPARRIEQWGFRSRPVGKVRSFWIRIGSSNVLYIGVAPTKGYGPTDLDEGEVAIYTDQVEKALWVTKDGANKINSKSGQDIVANGGSLEVARKTDKTIADATMTTWITKVTTAAATIDPTIVAPTDFGVINGGADHFKA